MESAQLKLKHLGTVLIIKYCVGDMYGQMFHLIYQFCSGCSFKVFSFAIVKMNFRKVMISSTEFI